MVLAYTALHYGKEYLKEAIEAVKNSVDIHLMLYTREPSYGHGTDMINPDTEEELKAICDQFDHVVWMDIENRAKAENVHRQIAIDYAIKNKFDIVLVVDSDEVWIPERVQEAIDYAANSSNGRFGIRGSQWVTLWKSFDEYVTDGFAPIRLFNLKNDINKEELIEKGFLYHMGYCISDALMEYKISCHGHKNDFRNNSGWYRDKWVNYKKGVQYLHPATQAYWIDAQPFDKTTLPDVLKKHKRYV
jgi:hypothetical protein